MAKKDNQTFKRTLPVALTDEEQRLRGVELAAKMSAIDKIDAKLQLAKDEAKAARAPLLKRVAELQRQVETKTEDREVECEEVLDFTKHRADTIRLDTMDVIGQRPLRSDEMQGTLTLLPGQARADEEA